jgi:hypothetical protein
MFSIEDLFNGIMQVFLGIFLGYTMCKIMEFIILSTFYILKVVKNIRKR